MPFGYQRTFSQYRSNVDGLTATSLLLPLLLQWLSSIFMDMVTGLIQVLSVETSVIALATGRSCCLWTGIVANWKAYSFWWVLFMGWFLMCMVRTLLWPMCLGTRLPCVGWFLFFGIATLILLHFYRTEVGQKPLFSSLSVPGYIIIRVYVPVMSGYRRYDACYSVWWISSPLIMATIVQSNISRHEKQLLY